MTHYMGLLAVNQPWNLLIFMAIPVVLAETLAITELYLLYTRNWSGTVHQVNRFAGIAVGLYFSGVIGYLLNQSEVEDCVSGDCITVSLPVSKGTVASRLSLTPEYFSRVLRELEEARLIEVDKRDIRIIDTRRLAAYSG